MGKKSRRSREDILAKRSHDQMQAAELAARSPIAKAVLGDQHPTEEFSPAVRAYVELLERTDTDLAARGWTFAPRMADFYSPTWVYDPDGRIEAFLSIPYPEDDAAGAKLDVDQMVFELEVLDEDDADDPDTTDQPATERPLARLLDELNQRGLTRSN